MSDLLLAMPAHRTPLVLRTTGHESTLRAAQGFGVPITEAQLARIEADLFAAFESASPQADGQTFKPNDPMALRQPDMARVHRAVGDGAQRLSPEATMTLLMSTLQATLGDASLQSLRQRLDMHRVQLSARVAHGGALAARLQAALDAAVAAQGLADAAAAEVGAQEGALNAAKEEVLRLRAELEALDPDDPAHAAKQAELGLAQAALQRTQSRLEAAGRDLIEAASALDQALGDLDAEQAKADAFNAGQPLGVDPGRQKKLDPTSTLQLIMGMLSRLMSEMTDSGMKATAEFTMTWIEMRREIELEKIRKHEEEVQRARDAEKKTGCAGKIFGWIGAAVGAIASIGAIVVGALHGNVALVAAGVMGMMLTVDSIVGMTTGFSVVGKTIEGLGNVISKALIAFGVPEDVAKQIGAITATVVVIVAIVAVMLVTGNIAAAGRTAAGAVVAAKAAADSGLTAARLVEQGSRILQFVAQAAGAIGQITQNAGQLVVAGIMLEATKLLAQIQESLFGNEVLLDMLRKLGEAVALQHRTALDLLVRMTEVADDRAETATSIVAHIRSRA
ncbi:MULTISPECIES: type III secretion system translocon subunit SctE [unclassified Stenotrophomonas]|jgi:hypothetical protein|uniref:type III secretion system translocon subunit SctE n=1 Tax=unclassified Stenotrophomonas TaxID=196198 RepID=UPI0005AF171B|nr:MULTISPECIES: type III secretion system translocon subunit SctE [unclassified Stenotrophomonas]KIP87797.1 hypothetical protein SN15_00260 [Stenotrophomonas maltophilia]MBD8644940.1 type III secretion system translocon subunit SctE [Stenotrophomonas sp. CFBP 13724]MDY1034417.1 type III secretion system translocon subunit SctE [Stenotrophomonas sp. CFBP8980]